MSDFEGGVRLMSSDGRDQFEPFCSLFHPDWRESEAQLTEKQAVLLMHDIYSVSNRCCSHQVMLLQIVDLEKHLRTLL